jgi:hypothetical protein
MGTATRPRSWWPTVTPPRLLARCVGNRLVSRIPVALHDAAIVIEQLERVDRTATRSVGVGDRRRVGPTPGAVIAGDRTEVAFLGGAAAGIERRRNRLEVLPDNMPMLKVFKKSGLHCNMKREDRVVHIALRLSEDWSGGVDRATRCPPASPTARHRRVLTAPCFGRWVRHQFTLSPSFPLCRPSCGRRQQ